MNSNIDVTKIQNCLDTYMVNSGKTEINEIEGNRILAQMGIMDDDAVYPGEPLRAYLRTLRDSNALPKNIRQSSCAWSIKHSRLNAKAQMTFMF